MRSSLWSRRDPWGLPVEPGYLVWAREGTLLAQRFDFEAGELVGSPTAIAPAVRVFQVLGQLWAKVSPRLLVYSLPEAETRVAAFDRSGQETALDFEPARYDSFALSPDETRLAAEVVDSKTGGPDLWILDLERQTRRKFTYDDRGEFNPIWSPDGLELIYGSDRFGPPHLMRQSLDSASPMELVPFNAEVQNATSWHPDGNSILFRQSNARQRRPEIWTLELDGESEPRLFLDKAQGASQATFSPDGRWVAYLSFESEPPEVFVRGPLDGQPRSYQVSGGGGNRPVWRSDGRELYFLKRGGLLMATDLELATTPSIGKPQVLFRVPEAASSSFAAADNGQTFYFVLRGEASIVEHRHVAILNWQQLVTGVD